MCNTFSWTHTKIFIYFSIICSGNIVVGVLWMYSVVIKIETSKRTFKFPFHNSVYYGTTTFLLLSGLLLLYGAVKKKTVCIFIYLAILLLGVLIETFVVGYSLITNGRNQIQEVVANIISLLILLPILYCVYLFYKEITDQEDATEGPEEIAKFTPP